MVWMAFGMMERPFLPLGCLSADSKACLFCSPLSGLKKIVATVTDLKCHRNEWSLPRSRLVICHTYKALGGDLGPGNGIRK